MPVTRSGNKQTLAQPSPRKRHPACTRHSDVIILSGSDDEPTVSASKKGQQKTPKKTMEKRRGKAKAKPFNAIGDIVEISSGEDSPIKSAHRVADLEKQIKKLQTENSQLKQECSQLKANVPLLEDHISCEICTLKLWSPYILGECGHTYCQSCLEDWFDTTLSSHMASHPEYDMQVVQHHQPQPQYTCPTCRKVVKVKPVEDFILKAIVRTVVKASGESTPKKKGKAGTAFDGYFRGQR